MNYYNVDGRLFVGNNIICITSLGDELYKIEWTRNIEVIKLDDLINDIVYLGNSKKEIKYIQNLFGMDPIVVDISIKHEFNNICVICYTNNSNMTCVPCGHRVICHRCLQNLEENELNMLVERCPICCSDITCIFC